MKAKKILKTIGIILIILIVLLIIHTIRNYIIISNLQSKISEYANSTNYYVKETTTEENGAIVNMEYYQKDNNEVVFLERILDGETLKLSMYNNGEKVDIFTESGDSKNVQIDADSLFTVNIYNYLETDNNLQTLLGSILSKIKLTTYNEKECYVISGFTSAITLNFEGQETYIEKDTGLYVKSLGDTKVVEKEYEFDNVDDSIFVEPDISQYTLIEATN